MKLSYEAMEKTLYTYLDSLSKLNINDKSTIEYSKQFLSEDYSVRFGDTPDYVGTDMMEGMAHENCEKWVTHVVYKKSPFYWMFDERKGTAAGYFAEELRDVKTNELLRSALMFSHITFIEENGEAKLWREHLVSVPSKLRIDCAENAK